MADMDFVFYSAADTEYDLSPPPRLPSGKFLQGGIPDDELDIAQDDPRFPTKHQIAELSRRSSEFKGMVQGLKGMAQLPTQSKRVTANQYSQSSNIGALDPLPLEIMFIILEGLSIRSTKEFRQVCRRACEIVNSMPSLQLFNTHATQIMYTLHRHWFDGFYTLSQLFTAFKTTRCVSCGFFGSYLFLATCERVCETCLQVNVYLRSVEIDYELLDWDESDEPLFLMFCDRNIPLKIVRELDFHFDFEHVLDFGLHMAIPNSRRDRPIYESIPRIIDAVEEVPPSAWNREPTITYDSHALKHACQLLGDVWASTLPSFISKDDVQHGIVCKWCLIHLGYLQWQLKPLFNVDMLPPLLTRPYSTEDFVTHVKTCPAVEKVLESIRTAAATPNHNANFANACRSNSVGIWADWQISGRRQIAFSPISDRSLSLKLDRWPFPTLSLERHTPAICVHRAQEIVDSVIGDGDDITTPTGLLEKIWTASSMLDAAEWIPY